MTDDTVTMADRPMLVRFHLKTGATLTGRFKSLTTHTSPISGGLTGIDWVPVDATPEASALYYIDVDQIVAIERLDDPAPFGDPQ